MEISISDISMDVSKMALSMLVGLTQRREKRSMTRTSDSSLGREFKKINLGVTTSAQRVRLGLDRDKLDSRRGGQLLQYSMPTYSTLDHSLRYTLKSKLSQLGINPQYSKKSASPSSPHAPRSKSNSHPVVLSSENSGSTLPTSCRCLLLPNGPSFCESPLLFQVFYHVQSRVQAQA
ncbi:hypothetical protein BGW80DRAFT_855916 [Lactifluus volemus]|nr:hypothetical protein BGW80DRAFT_855916 [Lactifluus volemus]